jgi:Uncharacterized protein conserved in bacteria (DUF2188)
MSTGKHYFIEQTDDGDYAVRAEDATRASARLPTQRAAYDKALEFNPDDHPNIERVSGSSIGFPSTSPSLWA